MVEISLITATRDRAELLARMALPSVLAQRDQDFEWIVVNDGGDPATSRLLEATSGAGRLRRLDMAHPETGFAPCFARNLGLSLARGEVAAYLDDDNALEPDFILRLRRDFDAHPRMQARIPLQRRRRDRVSADGERIQGEVFLSPKPEDELADFVSHRALFDSNGFAHRLPFAPRWNPDWRIYSDYEFLLQCLNRLSAEEIGVSRDPDVLYVQNPSGVIGGSGYAEWAEELDRLVAAAAAYEALAGEALAQVEALARRYRDLAGRQAVIPAFARMGRAREEGPST